MEKINTAIVLAGGSGNRLNPLTNGCPKCLIEINGVSILENALRNLERSGFEETIIVTGYLKDEIMNRFGSRLCQMKIIYVENKHYSKTNTMYGLWLARNYLEKGVVWMDGDIFFEEKVLKKVLNFDKAHSCWAVDDFTEEMDGAMLTVDECGRITNIRIINEKTKEYKGIYFKSAGIMKMNSELGVLFSNWLDSDVEMGNVNIYCDLVLAKHLDDYPFFICDIKGLRWYEIDNYGDLERAKEVFMNDC